MSTGAVLLAAPAPNRTAIVISAPLAGMLSVTQNTSDSATLGVNLAASGAPLVLDLLHHGNMVTKQFYGVMNTGTQSITCWETFLDQL